ncbi:hypothetical protein ACGFNV_46335 [Streptomyces sp. NPDC048751]|uniref:hypothetical protein n=1 Tax=Streptomyces sp. NPDC048751 TaxID=3365591 RepID=UPI003715749B
MRIRTALAVVAFAAAGVLTTAGTATAAPIPDICLPNIGATDIIVLPVETLTRSDLSCNSAG